MSIKKKRALLWNYKSDGTKKKKKKKRMFLFSVLIPHTKSHDPTYAKCVE